MLYKESNIQDGKPIMFETNWFILRRVVDGVNTGWELTAKKNITRFQCKSEYYGIPVISLNNTFQDYEYTEIDVTGMQVENVKTMYMTFAYCVQLKHLDLSNWDVTRLHTMEQTFMGCINLETINFNNWRTINLTCCDQTFIGCKSLEIIDIHSFTLDSMSDIDNIFNNCYGARIIDIRGFKVIDINRFYSSGDEEEHPSNFIVEWAFDRHIPQLELIIVSDERIAKQVMDALDNFILASNSSSLDGKLDIDKLKRIIDRARLIGHRGVVLLDKYYKQ